MEPSIELHPEKTLLVLGPEFAASLLVSDGGSNISSHVPPLGYTAFKRHLQEAVGIVECKEDSRIEEQLQTLKEHRLLHQWLREVFTLHETAVVQTPLAQRISKLQSLGALVAYLSPDTICEEAIKSSSLSINETLRWSTDCGSILHPFGVYTEPDSLLRWSAEPPTEFVNVLESRVCVCIGFSSVLEDQFLDHFMKLVNIHSKSLPIHLHGGVRDHHELQYPALHIQNILLPQGLCHIGETSKLVAQSIDFPPQEEDTRSLSLVLGNRNGLSNVTRIVTKSTGVNFVLMSTLQCNGLELHPLSVRVTRKLFPQFWSDLVSTQVASQLIDNAVLCIVFSHGPIVWLNNCGIGNNSIENSVTTTKTVGDENLSKSEHTSSSSPSPKCRLNNKPIPRWFTTKQKVSNSTNLLKEDWHSSSILHRRLSLPPHIALPPAQLIKTKQSSSVSVSNRQQLLISKYLFTRRHKATDPAGNSTLLRQLLQQEPKQFPKPDMSKGSPSDLIEKGTFQRRKDLFVEENSEWSINVKGLLSQKVAKWKRLHAKRKQTLIEKESERVLSSSTSTDAIRQHLSNSLSYSTNSIQPSLSLTTPQMSTVNQFMLPSTSPLPLATSSIIYPTSFLSSYPFLTTVPYVQTAPSSNLFLASNVPSVVTPTTSVTTSVTPNSYVNDTQKSVPHSSPLVLHSANTRTGKKHTSSSSQPTGSNSFLSSLLKQELDSTLLPDAKKRKSVMTNLFAGERSDGEEERSHSPQSPREGELWKFLLDLLLLNSHSDYIQWNPYVTMEFEIKRPKEIAQLWSSYLGNSSTSISKDSANFKHGLDFCCTKTPPVLHPVNNGKPHVYRFNHSVLYYINMRYTQQNIFTKASQLDDTREMSGSREVLVVD